MRTYEYWDSARGEWTLQQPAACLVRGVANPDPRAWKWRNGSPRTAADCKDYYCTYQNLWFNNGRFYLLVDGPHPVVSPRARADRRGGGSTAAGWQAGGLAGGCRALVSKERSSQTR